MSIIGNSKALHDLGNDHRRDFALALSKPKQCHTDNNPIDAPCHVTANFCASCTKMRKVYVQHEHGSMTLTASPPNSNKDLGDACSVSVTVRMQHRTWFASDKVRQILWRISGKDKDKRQDFHQVMWKLWSCQRRAGEEMLLFWYGMVQLWLFCKDSTDSTDSTSPTDGIMWHVCGM
jgi:hypothetical protein